ncbi:MAG: cytidine deaminase [candidate division WOR-3 bacterium]
MKEDYKEILEILKELLKNSYSPYSKFRVGAIALTKEGKIFKGVNIENASYGLTVCAERVAIFKAISEGYKDLEKIYIYADKNPSYPCGACLQVMAEFNKDMEIIIFDKDKMIKKKLKNLLTNPYNKLS